MHVSYGVGVASLVPSGSNPTPITIGGLQDVTVSIKYTKKKAYGDKQFPIAVARGEGEITWKAKSVMVSGAAVAAALTGSSVTAGTITPVISEPATIPSSVAYTVQVTNYTTFNRDLGVLDLTTGSLMKRVAAGAEATGKYSLDTTTGTYTFAIADAGKKLKVTYAYATAGSGETVKYTNQQMGSGATMQLNLFNSNPSQSKAEGLLLYATIMDGIDLAKKNNDFTMTDVSGEAFADANDNVLDFYVADNG